MDHKLIYDPLGASSNESQYEDNKSNDKQCVDKSSSDMQKKASQPHNE
jgi:hypothetical protein